jgi:hypothetical protein
MTTELSLGAQLTVIADGHSERIITAGEKHRDAFFGELADLLKHRASMGVRMVEFVAIDVARQSYSGHRLDAAAWPLFCSNLPGWLKKWAIQNVVTCEDPLAGRGYMLRW